MHDFSNKADTIHDSMASADSYPSLPLMPKPRHNCSWPVRQLSPDKNVNFAYTTTAFTLSHESLNFVMLY